MSTRIYQPIELTLHSEIVLSPQAAQHLVSVLRLKPGAEFIVFNGKGGEFLAVLTSQGKRQFGAKLVQYQSGIAEPSCQVTLGQGISKGERMDYAIQKSVELGVYAIQPLITDHMAHKLSPERQQQKHQHWQAIAISAAEQSQRCTVPTVHPPILFDQWLTQSQQEYRLILDPTSRTPLPSPIPHYKEIAVLVGPEGGFSQPEITSALKHNFSPIHLGSRILRTETAAAAIMAILQYTQGNFV